MDRHFAKEDLRANKHKRVLNVPVLRKIQSKTTMRYHFIPSRMAVIIKAVTTVGKAIKKWVPIYIAGKNIK